MHQFQKSRIILLQELQALVNENLSREPEFITHDIRRYNRKLKAMRITITEWMKDLVIEQKLKEETRQEAEDRRKKTEAYYATDPSNRDQ